MSDAPDKPAETPPPEAPPETPPATEEGSKFVADLASPEGQARFKRVYWQMKENERVVAGLSEHNRLLQERLEQIESSLSDGRREAAISQTKALLKEAKDRGLTDREVELQSHLVKLAQPEAKKPGLPQPPQPTNFNEIAVREWATAIDEQGNFLRPWAHPSHPKYQEVYDLTRDLVGQTGGQDVDAILGEIDRRMRPAAASPRKPAAPSVLPGGQRPPRGRGDADLTPEQEAVARAMGVTPDAYRQQLKLIRGASS